MKRFTLFVVGLLAAGLSVQASSYTDDNGFTWYYITNEDGTNTITLTNSNEAETTISEAWTTATELTIPKSFTIDGTEYTITRIGAYCFYNCTTITSVSFGTTTTDDGSSSAVTSIGEYAFYSCSALGSITLPSGLTSIGSSCFAWCTSLTSIEIPSGVTSLDGDVFSRCYGLKKAVLNEGFTTLGSTVFWHCTGLEEVSLPSTLTTLGTNNFSGCTSLATITIPDGVTTIGDYSFYNCTSLPSINIPAAVSSIGKYAFYSCSALGSITLPSGLTSIGSSCFAWCTSLTSIEIPSGVTSLDGDVFSRCYGLKKAVLNEGFTTLGSTVFWHCTGLEEVSLPSTLTTLGTNNFSGCTSLATIAIPANVTTIGAYSFYDCTALTTMICYATSIPTASYSNTFGEGSSSYTGGKIGVTKLYVLPYSLGTWSAVTSTDYWSTVFTSTEQLYPVYKLTVGSDGLATLALPFTATIPDGVTCYTMSLNNDGSVAVGTEYTEATLAAGTAVVVKADAGTYAFLGTQNYTEDVDASVENTVLPVYDADNTATTSSLVGVYQTTVLTSESDGDNYVLQKQNDEVKFYQVLVASGDISVGAFRAYLHVDDSEAESINLDFSNTATGISTVATEAVAPTTGVYYDLQGRAVKAPQKGGIYIVDGKKVVI